jgi:hypothetical protein
MKKILSLSMLLFLQVASFSQETITVISEGSGNSYEAARNSSLRNAIEKIYGTFVSTSTIVNNGQLQKDEIFTFSSGSVSNFQEISSIVVNGKHSVTLKVTMSKQKLATFIKSNGKNIDYDATEFVSGIKAKVINEKLAEESELNIINSLSQFAQKVFPDCLDYEITASEPYLGIIFGWTIQLDLKFKTNKNLDILNNHIHKTLQAIDYNYIDEPQRDWGFRLYTSDKYPEVGEVVTGSPAAIGQLKRRDKILAIKIGNASEYISLKGRSRDLPGMLEEAKTKNVSISFELQSEEKIVNERRGTFSYEYGEKKVLEIKPGFYTVRTRRTHDDREDLGQATFTLNYNGTNYEMRSNASRTIMHQFVSQYTWGIMSAFKVEMNAGKYSKIINLRPVIANRNVDFSSTNRQYSRFSYDLDARVGRPALELKEYKGIDAETSYPSASIYIKDALRYYVAQDEVAYMSLSDLKAKYSCYIEYSENKDASLDFISSIKGFKVIKP